MIIDFKNLLGCLLRRSRKGSFGVLVAAAVAIGFCMKSMKTVRVQRAKFRNTKM